MAASEETLHMDLNSVSEFSRVTSDGDNDLAVRRVVVGTWLFDYSSKETVLH